MVEATHYDTSLLNLTCRLLVHESHDCSGGNNWLLIGWFAQLWGFSCLCAQTTGVWYALQMWLFLRGGKTRGKIKKCGNWEKKITINKCSLKKPQQTEESEQGADESYLHPCRGCRSTGVHSLDVAWFTSSNHKAPANCVTNNLERKTTISKQQPGSGNLKRVKSDPGLTVCTDIPFLFTSSLLCQGNENVVKTRSLFVLGRPLPINSRQPISYHAPVGVWQDLKIIAAPSL